MNLDFADVKPSVVNFLLIGVMAVAFIFLLKALAVRWYIPGISEVAAAV